MGGHTCICRTTFRAVIKIQAGDFPRLLSMENKRKIEPKETPSCLIHPLLVVFTRELEILVTTLTLVV